jgi:hypothetical protein
MTMWRLDYRDGRVRYTVDESELARFIHHYGAANVRRVYA